MTLTRQKLLENFDDEVREKLRVRDEAAKENLNRFEQLLMRLTHHELDDEAEFQDSTSFRLISCPVWADGADIPLGLYELPRRSGEAHLYRRGHPLGESVIARARGKHLSPSEIVFDYSNHTGKISILEPLVGRSGWLAASLLTVEALDQAEDHVLFAAEDDDGSPIGEEICRRLLTLDGRVTSPATPSVAMSLSRAWGSHPPGRASS